MKLIRDLFLITLLCSMLFLITWIISLTGVGYVSYYFALEDSAHEWAIVTEPGSLNLAEVYTLRYLDFGLHYGFYKNDNAIFENLDLDEIGLSGDSISPMTGNLRFQKCSEGTKLYGIGCAWIISMPLWIPTITFGLISLALLRHLIKSKEAQQAAT